MNKYSITPNLFEKYLENLILVNKTLGEKNKKILKREKETLELLERGVYFKDNFKKYNIEK